MSRTSDLSQVLRQGVTPGATNAQKRDALHVAVNEIVGRTFFGSMLKMARNSAFKSDIGHGGRGEEIFRAQLDDELVQRISRSSNVDFLDAMYDRLAGRYPIESTASAAGQGDKRIAPPGHQVQQAYEQNEPGIEENARG